MSFDSVAASDLVSCATSIKAAVRVEYLDLAAQHLLDKICELQSLLVQV